MIINWRLYLTVAAVTSAFLLGGYLGYTNGPTRETFVPAIMKLNKVEEKIVYKDRVVNRKVVTEKKPDGSVKETVEEVSKESEQLLSKETQVQESKPAFKPNPQYKKYSLGIGLVRKWDRSVLDPKLIPEYSIGYGLTESVRLKFGVIPSDKMYTLGIELHF